jgi:predicted enzyme related to lactoylglutathione lyase
MKTRTPARGRGDTKAKAPAKASVKKHVPTKGLYGWITHTDLASNDPGATKAWAIKVLGWTFRQPMPTPNGPIHLFAYSEQGGGGIRPINPPEIPGSIPYIHVADCQASYDKALREGAEEMMSPTKVMEGVTVAIVRAPGGVPIGFSGP